MAATIKGVLGACLPVPTAALHGPRATAREGLQRTAVVLCDGCKRPSTEGTLVNEFGVICVACCKHVLLGGENAPCVRCGAPCGGEEGGATGQHVCVVCMCVEACGGGEREAAMELQRILSVFHGEAPPGTRDTLRAACDDMEARERDVASLFAAAPVPALGALAVVRCFDVATRKYTVALEDGSGTLQRATNSVRLVGQKLDVPGW